MRTWVSFTWGLSGMDRESYITLPILLAPRGALGKFLPLKCTSYWTCNNYQMSRFVIPLPKGVHMKSPVTNRNNINVIMSLLSVVLILSPLLRSLPLDMIFLLGDIWWSVHHRDPLNDILMIIHPFFTILKLPWRYFYFPCVQIHKFNMKIYVIFTETCLFVRSWSKIEVPRDVRNSKGP